MYCQQAMKSLLLFLLALLSSVPTIATYYKVAGENDPLLQNSTKLFEDFLFPSAKWKAEDVDQNAWIMTKFKSN